MPTYYPQVSADGVMTQIPYRRSMSFNSLFVDAPFSRPYSASRRGSGLSFYPTAPLGRFEVNYTAMADADVQTLLTFFNAQQGRYGEFIFLDPAGNLVNNSEDFSQTNWATQTTGVTISATGVTDPFGGTRASTLTATSSNSNMSPIVVPGGFLPANFALNVSVYLRALTAAQSFSLGFVDSGFSVLGSKTFALPQNVWKRIDFSMLVNTTSYIRALFGGFSTWNSTAIQFFGPQCAPLIGPGSYKKSPDDFGYHPNCRFDTDSFSYTAMGPNQNTLSLPVMETNN